MIRFALSVALLCSALRAAEIPKPLPGNPGNIFLEGQEVAIPAPAGSGETWNLLDYDGKELASGSFKEGGAALGKLPVGYYELHAVGGVADPAPRVSLAVLSPLKAPTPPTSPIGLDVGMAWFFKPDRMPIGANLTALAGVNHVRDRLNWGEVEPQRGKFAEKTKYDDSASAQSSAGLRVLQVNHISPRWASEKSIRFPSDLRDYHRFCEEAARRWTGKVTAFEPWNEADIEVFGGHTGAEMAALQKAAYFGLKSGNPDAIACLNVFASNRQATVDDLDANGFFDYCDTINLHHYNNVDGFPNTYKPFQQVARGKPLWTTECAMPVKWADEKTKEPSPADLKVQATRVPMVYAGAIHEGSSAVFYFFLPHYVEHQTQFGLLRPDLTPRPGYVALAAVGRLLADARPVGRIPHENKSVKAFVFDARPDGAARRVLVVWVDGNDIEYQLPAAPREMFDHLGRKLAPAATLMLTRAPVYAIYPETTEFPELTKAHGWPSVGMERRATPCAVVFQPLMPREQSDVNLSCYKLSPGTVETIEVMAYHFGTGKDIIQGTLNLTAPEGVKIPFPQKINLQPGIRLSLPLKFKPARSDKVQTIRIDGDFGAAGKSVVSIRYLAK